MKNSLFLSLLIVSSTQAMEQSAPIDGFIKSFESSRDLEAIEKIIAIDKNSFDFEGPLVEILEAYGNRKTDVLCVNNTTVGFINYMFDTTDLTPYYYNTYGYIALFGIDTQQKKEAYGVQLLDNAVKNMEMSGVYHIDINALLSSDVAKLCLAREFVAVRRTNLDLTNPKFLLRKTYDIPADQDERTVFQRYPKTTAGITSSALVALAFVVSKR